MNAYDARAILLHRIESVQGIREWLESNPLRKVCGIYPDAEAYLIVYLKDIEEIQR